MNILVLNCGSSSLKFQVVDTVTEQCVRKGVSERLDNEHSFRTAIDQVLVAVEDIEIAAVGHRVVHGGDQFRQGQLIDDSTIIELRKLIPLAPLHNPANIEGIVAARIAFPNCPHVAVFDTAFHTTMPRRASTYAIDQTLAKDHGLRRYGFHGTSHQFVCRRASDFLGVAPDELRIISCHLGNGASACAIEFGQSVETSMGMTPLEGLVMGTRSGDIDPGAVLHIQRADGLSIDETDELLNRRSGLAGLSGGISDMRDLEQRAAAGDDNARLAITVFCHRVKKYIGAYAAVMGGVDVVILTGGIGENSALVRRRILQRLEFLGLRIDEDANSAVDISATRHVAAIQSENSRVKALVVGTNEELMIARETAEVIGGGQSVNTAGQIPIAISARHVHLDEATLQQLFGPNAELTKYRDISQPGQYASEQKVNLIGPKGRIDGVRILGPLRSRNQIEISRTDEFTLGVDAPIRRSGKTDGSAPITIEGPAGTVSLDEGLICAWRHIHMTGDDAERFGVESGQYVEVAVTGGERDLIFQDVLVRVAPAYVLEMHIDTDEANAAELSPSAVGDLVYTDVGAAAHAELRSKKP